MEQLIPLKQVLMLVGELDDTQGLNPARERFRTFLSENLTQIGDMRDYIEECLRTPGDQYNKALQDLVNHLGRLLGFDVTFGRYRGVQGEIGYDGIWKSPSGLYIVIEVKTSDVYTIYTSTLIGYIDKLISEHVIPDWDHALGLYVIGRNDYGVKQLENTIIAEKRTDKLRIITADKLLSLAELLADYEVAHEAVLTVLQPMGPMIDPLVELISSLVAQEINVEVNPLYETDELNSEPSENNNDTKYYLALVASHEGQSADEWIKILLNAGIYAITKHSSLQEIKQGDRICFYVAGKGVVAHAQVKSPPVKTTHPLISPGDKYQYIIELESISIYAENPVVLDAELREQLDAFQGRDPSKSWAWFVQCTREITKHDFMLLTKQ
jgi:hypothetical protein